MLYTLHAIKVITELSQRYPEHSVTTVSVNSVRVSRDNSVLSVSVPPSPVGSRTATDSRKAGGAARQGQLLPLAASPALTVCRRTGTDCQTGRGRLIRNKTYTYNPSAFSGHTCTHPLPLMTIALINTQMTDTSLSSH